MSRGLQWKLYFVAAALFMVAAAIGFVDRGLEVKTLAGLLMAGALAMMGISAYRATKQGG